MKQFEILAGDRVIRMKIVFFTHEYLTLPKDEFGQNSRRELDICKHLGFWILLERGRMKNKILSDRANEQPVRRRINSIRILKGEG